MEKKREDQDERSSNESKHGLHRTMGNDCGRPTRENRVESVANFAILAQIDFAFVVQVELVFGRVADFTPSGVSGRSRRNHAKQVGVPLVVGISGSIESEAFVESAFSRESVSLRVARVVVVSVVVDGGDLESGVEAEEVSIVVGIEEKAFV